MAEVLGVGVTHYPPLMGLDEKMSWVLEWTLEDPDIPEAAKNPAAWPAAMQAEFGSDRGLNSAAVHRAHLVDGFVKVRQALDDFQPDVVLVWGDDQYENFQEDVIPAFAILGYEEDVTATPWARTPFANIWNESKETEFKIKGAPEFGRYLATALLEDDFDIAYAYKKLHHATLPHSFLNALLLLDYDRTGLEYPVLPMSVNCYGRRIISFKGGRSRIAESVKPYDPPSPSPRRCVDLGAAIARAALASPWRVALVASSSWSHAFLTDHTNRLYADMDADRRLYDALVVGDVDTWRNTSLQDVEHAGQQEVLNWFCLVGAMAELKVTPSWSSLVETHVFNSNKVFAVYPPAGR
jgi:hypothetical protein